MTLGVAIISFIGWGQILNLSPAIAPSEPDLFLKAAESASGESSLEGQVKDLLFPDDEKKRILAILERQKQAFESEDISLYAVDLITTPPKTKRTVERFFEEHDEIRVSFQDPEIIVEDEKALVIMLQTTSFMAEEEGRPKTVMSRVLWKLVNIDGNWKIYETKILEKP
jgi:hypothetical protein